MKKYVSFFIFIGFLLLYVTSCIRQPQEAPTACLDMLQFGDAASEAAHGFQGARSEVITGGLGEPARRILPLDDDSWKSGPLEFTMKVDPEKQNYVTVKFWGSDCGEERGRLFLYVNGKQVGYQKEGDHDVLNQCDDEPLAPGRFVYVTVPLPPMLTAGCDKVDLKILPVGRKWSYGQTWEQLQKPLTEPTRGIYCAYTHTDVRFVPPVEEKQGEQPPHKVRATHGPEVIEQSKTVVNTRLGKLLERASASKAPGHIKGINGELALLAKAYQVEWTPAYRNPAVIDLIVRDGDALATTWAADRGPIEGEWSGAGYLGSAIMATWTEIEPKLDERIRLANGKSVTRREAWADALQGSRDYWRTHRRSYTNQSMIVDIGIYSANRALQLLAPQRALPEAHVLRFLHESAGIEPWVGSDPGGETTGQKDVPMQNIHAPYGENYYLFTRKGLSRELGWVGTYGETNFTFLREMMELSGDEKLREQFAKLHAARMPFRYPGYDGEGYHCMKLCSEIDNRTAHFPLSGSAYSQPKIREAWGLEVAAALPDDSIAVGAVQQFVEDGQYFAYVAERLAKNDSETLGMMQNVDNWETYLSLPKSDYRLPMTPGKPDFVFSDEEDAVLVIKNGEEMLFMNMYYRAERGVNRVARILDMNPKFTRLVTARTDVEVISSCYEHIRQDWTESTRSNRLVPPDGEIHQAWAGEVMPISKRPDDATQPEYGSWGPFLGKAAFYSLHYGRYLIGLNTTEAHTYSLKVPADSTYTDLVSGKKVRVENGSIEVAPLSTVVLYPN